MSEALKQDRAEQQRLQAVLETGLLDTPPEPDFDELVELARELCDVPVCAITLLDDERQFLKAKIGVEVCSTPRSMAICDYTIRSAGPFVVENLSEDARFAENPLVTGPMGMRFYAGVPVRSDDRHAVGSLCVMDTRPRKLTAQQMRGLEILARQVEARVHLRTRMREMEQQAADINAQRELLYHFLDNMPMEAALKDAQGRIIFYNRAIAEHFHLDRTEWLHKTDIDLWGRERGMIQRAEEEFVLQSGQRQESYAELPGPDGLSEYWKLIRSPFQLPCGEQLLSVVGVNLTTELRREAELMKLQEDLEEANRKLRSLSLTDELTGLWNRRAFDARLETELFAVERSGHALTLLLLDVDNFKALNDTFGHSHGDEVLQEVGAVLQRAVRAEDVAVRYGGEEFAIILPNTGPGGGEVLCKRISNLLKRVPWKHREVTVSAGIAIHRPGLSSDGLLNMADTAMYCAKRAGKNRAMTFADEMMAK